MKGNDMDWHQAATRSDLAEGPIVWKQPPLQLALFQVGEQVFAVDNRCPHEGYPLVDGDVDESNCLLTCQWHNWKFRLGDGECVLGGDHLRAYPTETRGDEIWVNLEPPSKDKIEQSVLVGLRRAFDERDFGRICRETARLHYNQIDPTSVVLRAVEWSWDRLEYGCTHAYAASADWLHYYDQWEGQWDRQLVALSECVDHIAFDALRHPEFPFAKPGERFSRVAFLEAVESENREGAESMIGSALEDGMHWRQLEEPIVAAALAHYNDFGHSLIYTFKSKQLIERLGVDAEPYIIRSLVRSLCYTTREDLTPTFTDYAQTLACVRSSLGQTTDHSETGTHDVDDPGFRSVKDTFSWVCDTAKSHSPQAIYQALLAAIARNLLCFNADTDLQFRNTVTDNIGWLHFSHGVTFSNAVRRMCREHPHLWPEGLVQMACFLGRNYKYVDRGLADSNEWPVSDEALFWSQVEETLIDHGFRDPIFSSHFVKTSRAVREEAEVGSPQTSQLLLASLNRLLHAPIKQKHVRRLALQADALVKRDFVVK